MVIVRHTPDQNVSALGAVAKGPAERVKAKGERSDDGTTAGSFHGCGPNAARSRATKPANPINLSLCMMKSPAHH